MLLAHTDIHYLKGRAFYTYRGGFAKPMVAGIGCLLAAGSRVGNELRSFGPGDTSLSSYGRPLQGIPRTEAATGDGIQEHSILADQSLFLEG